jgi:peroxiredoxin
MSVRKSQMTKLGEKAPEFSLEDVRTGKNVSLQDFKDKKAFLVMFICRHCPFVKHIEEEIAKLGKDYKGKNVGIVAISANDPKAYPADAPNSLKEQAEELGINFPYLFDEKQDVTKAYGAICTPDFFLFNKNRELVYRGQMDSSRPGKVWEEPTGKDIRGAIDAVLADKKVPEDHKPSIGCSIKWKKGNEPEYAK